MPRTPSGPTTPVPNSFINTTDQKLAVIINDLKDIKPQVNETNKAVVELKTDMKNMGERVSKVETKVEEGHECYNVDVIAELKTSAKEQSTKFVTDAREDAEQAEKIRNLAKEAAALEADVDDIKKAPRRMFYGMLGIIVTIVSSSLGAAWFLAKLDTRMESEREQRTLQITNIEKQINAVGDRADPTPLQTEINALQEVVETSNGHEEEFNALCDGMTRFSKRFFREDLIKRGKRIPTSCLANE